MSSTTLGMTLRRWWIYFVPLATVNCLPKLQNPLYQFLLPCWLHLTSDVLLFVPHVFNWVKIRRFCWSTPPIDILGCQEISGVKGVVFRVIICHKSMRIRINVLYKWHQSLLQNVYIKVLVHSAGEDADPVLPHRLMPAHTCTLYGCFGLSWRKQELSSITFM